MSKLHYGDSAAREVSKRIAAPVATLAALKAYTAKERVAGMMVRCTADDSVWRFHGTSALTGDDLLVVTPTAGSGRWLREVGCTSIRIPITFAKADAAVLLTVQAGCALLLHELYWEVTTNWSGGSSSTIGVSSNKTGFTTKGDLLGGAAGSAAAALTTTIGNCVGTIGAGFDTLAKRRVVWSPTENILHDRITSAFTAGAGNLVLISTIVKNDGA